MKPSAFRIERLLAKVEAEVERRWLRARRYVFHPDEIAEAEAQGLPYALVPRVLSKQEWLERYATPGAEAEFYARLRYGEQPAGADSGVKTIQEPAATALLPNCS